MDSSETPISVSPAASSRSVDPYAPFRNRLAEMDRGQGGALAAALHAATIGEGVEIETPFGRPRLTYVDHVASGRALEPVETFMIEHALPFYANTHTEASYCGSATSLLRETARRIVAAHVEAGPETAVVFTGSGATAGLNRLVGLLNVAAACRLGRQVVVLCGPYEHHSNILPWRESGAKIVRICEGPRGGPDLDELRAALAEHADADMRIGAFSAVSNVTGIVTDVTRVTRMLKRAGALAVWDWAAGAPYLPMSMRPAADAMIDAITYSSHKFPGGPGASGILAVRRTAVRTDVPTAPGGGTVTFVSPWAHDYSTRLEAREEGGTPGILGDVRAALVVLTKDALGASVIESRHKALNRIASSGFGGSNRIRLFGLPDAGRIPIYSFAVRDSAGAPVHHQLFTRMLSDIHGIQARGGCACAGPYAHDLLKIDETESEALRQAIAAGKEGGKPGWVRMNLSYLLDDAKAARIVATIVETAMRVEAYRDFYDCDPATARFTVRPV